jgi:predicted PurR-regulated permease PerM
LAEERKRRAPAREVEKPVRVVNFRSLVFWTLAVYLSYHLIDLITVTVTLFALAFFFAIVLDPPIRKLDRRGLSRGWSVAVIALTVLGAVGLALFLAVPPIIQESADLVRNSPQYAEQLRQRLMGWLASYPELQAQVADIQLDQGRLTELGQNWLPRIGRYSLSLLGGLFSFFVIFVITLYTLADPGPLVRGAVRAAPPEYRGIALRILARISLQLQGWVRATFWMMLIIGVMSGVGLWLLGVKGALLFGIIAGIGEAIPTIGPIISAIPPIVVTLASDDPNKAIWVALLFFVVQQVENNLLVPRIMSATMNLHPVSVLFFVIAMGGLMGPLGILLATPLCAITKVIYDEVYRRRIQRQPIQRSADAPSMPSQ